MSNSQFTCPHCKQQVSYKLIPLKTSPPTTFEQTFGTPDIAFPTEPKSIFWQSDGINFTIAGVFTGSILLVFSWWYSLDLGVLVAAAALATGLGLHVLKLWLYRPHAEPGRNAPTTTKLQIEHIDDSKHHWLLDELEIDIRPDTLRDVARAIVHEDFKWTQAINCSAGLSQTKHHKLKDKFLAMQYIQALPNNANGYSVTGRGRRVLQEIALSPIA